jgi:hypothetical protein
MAQTDFSETQSQMEFQHQIETDHLKSKLHDEEARRRGVETEEINRKLADQDRQEDYNPEAAVARGIEPAPPKMPQPWHGAGAGGIIGAGGVHYSPQERMPYTDSSAAPPAAATGIPQGVEPKRWQQYQVELQRYRKALERLAVAAQEEEERELQAWRGAPLETQVNAYTARLEKLLGMAAAQPTESWPTGILGDQAEVRRLDMQQRISQLTDPAQQGKANAVIEALNAVQTQLNYSRSQTQEPCGGVVTFTRSISIEGLTFEAGTQAQVVSRDGDDIRIRYNSNDYLIPVSATNCK